MSSYKDPIQDYSKALQTLQDLKCDDYYNPEALAEFYCMARSLRNNIRKAWNNLPTDVQNKIYKHPCTTYNE